MSTSELDEAVLNNDNEDTKNDDEAKRPSDSNQFDEAFQNEETEIRDKNVIKDDNGGSKNDECTMSTCEFDNKGNKNGKSTDPPLPPMRKCSKFETYSFGGFTIIKQCFMVVL